jgi:hypothetical protein
MSARTNTRVPHLELRVDTLVVPADGVDEATFRTALAKALEAAVAQRPGAAIVPVSRSALTVDVGAALPREAEPLGRAVAAELLGAVLP